MGTKRQQRTSRTDYDAEIDRAKNSGKQQTRTDAFAEGKGYLGVDDLDRLRRRKLK